MVNLAICIDPVRIAVGGGMTRSWDRIRPRLDAALEAAAPYRPELVLAASRSTRRWWGRSRLPWTQSQQPRRMTVSRTTCTHAKG